ncbi:hypothetical protein [Colwellia sp. MB02u-9]|uniref:hypothetical protein n=1 Tax=Colwellia sp. MB02u-9 TaxID=2759823 RepID=UPI0015F5C406|nr:hypothetical protein [Colwellia sp. MB02u-9]MBA6296646.1 hypothetical protein [Colwellia sp. MB02u-9]
MKIFLVLLSITTLFACSDKKPFPENKTIFLKGDANLGVHFVNVKTLNVRELPNKNSKIIDKKIFRQQIDIKELQGEWARINWYKDENKKKSEWVFMKFTSKDRAEAPKSKYEINKIHEYIPSSNYDNGKYFLVYIEKLRNTLLTIHQRVGVNVDAYTKTEINCENMKYRVLGYTEHHWDNLIDDQYSDPDWVSLVEGSSKTDLVNFACTRDNK